jgi:hypothetical protein
MEAGTCYVLIWTAWFFAGVVAAAGILRSHAPRPGAGGIAP